jgi:glycosyltransferase involved in cell wall biosynthesis
MHTPKVTVLMPVHNGERFLREAIDSILNQTFTDFDFLIIDDGSRDGSCEIIASYTDRRIILITNQDNRGTVHVLNQGIAEAKGKYIVRMDADDISLPNRLATQVRFMDNHPDTGISGTGMRLIKKGKLRNTRTQPDSDEKLKATLLFNTCFFHPTVIIRTELAKACPYPADLVYTQDYNYWTALAPTTRFANLTDTLLYFREHEGQTSNRKADLQITNARRIRATYLKKFANDITSEELEIHNKIAENCKNIDLLKAKTWLEHLVEVNKKNKMFFSEVFEKEIAKKWWHCCRKNTPHEKKTLKIYGSSYLQQHYRPAASKYLKFWLRCRVF